MDTLIKLRWLIALVLIIGFLIYYNERNPNNDAILELTDSLKKYQSQISEIESKNNLLQYQNSLKDIRISDLEQSGTKIIQNNTNYKQAYSKLPIDETDKIFKAIASKNKKLVVYENAGHESLLIKEPEKWRTEIEIFFTHINNGLPL